MMLSILTLVVVRNVALLRLRLPILRRFARHC